MATSKPRISREEWEKTLELVRHEKEDMNKLVMHFLVTEGYAEAVQKFQMESGSDPGIDYTKLTDRMAVKKAVQCGDVEDAVKKVNKLNPEILNTNPGLLFRLLQQKCIELIRQGNIEMALEIAQTQLAPIGVANESVLEELERTISLLAFEDVSKSPFGELMEFSQRLKTASELDEAILNSHGIRKDPWLNNILQQLVGAQTLLDEKVVYPRINDFWSARLDDPPV